MKRCEIINSFGSISRVIFILSYHYTHAKLDLVAGRAGKVSIIDTAARYLDNIGPFLTSNEKKKHPLSSSTQSSQS